jgi:hypothetical protein
VPKLTTQKTNSSAGHEQGRRIAGQAQAEQGEHEAHEQQPGRQADDHPARIFPSRNSWAEMLDA